MVLFRVDVVAVAPAFFEAAVDVRAFLVTVFLATAFLVTGFFGVLFFAVVFDARGDLGVDAPVREARLTVFVFGFATVSVSPFCASGFSEVVRNASFT